MCVCLFVWCLCGMRVCVVDICVYGVFVCVCACALMCSSTSVPIQALNALSPATIAGMFKSKGLNNKASETYQGPCPGKTLTFRVQFACTSVMKPSSLISFVMPSSSLWILVTALFDNMETTLDSMISCLDLKVYMFFDRNLKEYFAWSLLKLNINASLSLAHISWFIAGTMAINYRK